MFRASAGKAVAVVEGMTVTGFEENAGAPPLEFRLQIAIEVCAATGPAA